MHARPSAVASRAILSFTALLFAVAAPLSAHAEVYRTEGGRGGALAFSDNVRFLQGRSSGTIEEAQPAARELATTAAASYGSTVSVPFAEEHGLIKVNSRLNAVLDLPFYVDTGTSDIMIPLVEARRLGFCPSCPNERISVMSVAGMLELPVMYLDSISLGGARVSNVKVIVNEHIQVGLLGRGFLKNFVYTVDAQSQTMEFKRRAAR